MADGTQTARAEAVKRAIDYMIAHRTAPLQLPTIARVALMSPFHFHRVFRELTSTTPARFLASLRMGEAQRLLVSSARSVTEICTAVGYSSVGTFVSQFGRLTGVPPKQFRRLTVEHGDLHLRELAGLSYGGQSLVGTVGTGATDCSHALVGLFPDQRLDEGPAVASVTSTCRLAGVEVPADGRYSAVAVGFDGNLRLRDIFAAPLAQPRAVGFGGTIGVSGGAALRSFHVVLRHRRMADPPVAITRSLLRILDRWLAAAL